MMGNRTESSFFVLLSLALSLVVLYSPNAFLVAANSEQTCSSDYYSAPAEFNLTASQIEDYERDGFIIVKGLIQGEDLTKAIQAVNKIQKRQSIGQRIFYKLMPTYKNLSFQTWRSHKALEHIAFDSAAPTISAKLMGLDSSVDGETRSLRLLKDAVLGYTAGDKGCGWHVDDKMFWPCEDQKFGDRDAGINVWITLSPISAKEGGGLAVAKGSHKVSFAEKAREVIAEKGGQTTCHLESLDPQLNANMEELKELHDLEAGDAIFHNRYLFHRVQSLFDEENSRNKKTKQRISLRYVSADDTFYDDMGREGKAIEARGLKTGDVVSKGGPWFPQTWPYRLTAEKNVRVKAEKNPFDLLKVLKLIKNFK